jgi:hypothetical protein
MKKGNFLNRKQCDDFGADFVRLAPMKQGVLCYQFMNPVFDNVHLVDMLKTFRAQNPDLFLQNFGLTLTTRLDGVQYQTIDDIARFGSNQEAKHNPNERAKRIKENYDSRFRTDENF